MMVVGLSEIGMSSLIGVLALGRLETGGRLWIERTFVWTRRRLFGGGEWLS